MASKKNLQKSANKQDKKIKRLYALIWFLACPLVYVIALLLKFTQINVVYWTLIVIPVLLAIYNVRQVPPVAAKASALAEAPAVPMEQTDGGLAQEVIETPAAEQTEDDYALDVDGVTRTQHIKLIFMALKAPLVIALPLLITVITALFFAV